MADEQDRRADGGGPPEDLGAPIAELRLLDEAPSAGFLGRLLGSLRRRDLSSQLVTLSWDGFGTVLLEFLNVIFSSFDPSARKNGGSD